MQASVCIVIIGLATYCNSLMNSFQGDDFTQIVNNVPVHSIKNIQLFFEGGTFYSGQGLAPLSGAYFRPLMTTVFSVIYTIFGAHPIYFHAVQLLLGIGSAVLLYLFFRYTCKPALALFLALVFLVHPIDSEIVFAIPVMQDALYFFFGMLALYLLVRFSSRVSLLPVCACLFLALLSKETAILFFAVSLIYVFWWDRKRFIWLIGVMIVPIALYVVLRINAIGFLGSNPQTAPIDRLDLVGRLLTAPSIFLLYISKFIVPWKLSSEYYWAYSVFSVNHVLLPLFADSALLALFAYGAFCIKRMSTKAQYATYLFFLVWFLMGMLLILQIVPLDCTASEPWFYFPMAGLLGMIGTTLTVIKIKASRQAIVLVGLILMIVLCARTIDRSFNWRSSADLARADIAASPDNYNAYDVLAIEDINDGNLAQARAYSQQSIAIYPTYTNYANLGVADMNTGMYADAVVADTYALKYGNFNIIYENLSGLALIYGNPLQTQPFITNALLRFPDDPVLWTNLALLDYEYHDDAGARIAITNAARYGQVSSFIYGNIMANRPFMLDLGNTQRAVLFPSRSKLTV
jgi:tetratricopeptide (TPR) repeat protein